MSALSVAPGTIFARDFLVERALAEGGMGAVYVVRQISTGRLRALKLMQPELVQNDDLRRRFLLEAKIGASIASEHIVEVQQAGIDDATGAPFLVMELLDGADLHAFLEQRGPLPIDVVRELFRQLCHALRLAHEAGIVHRDLKPPNVFLAKPKRAAGAAAAASPDFHVKVLDFGIAKMTTDATAGGAKTGMIGTPLWMAPEQAEHVPVTTAADVWALGLILYTCVTGRSFWRSASRSASLQQIMREMLFDPIPAPADRAREQGAPFPPSLDSVIARSIVRRPEQRLPDAGAFFTALEDALSGKTTSVVAAASVTSPGIELEEGAPDGPSLELAVRPRPVTIPRPEAATLADPRVSEAWKRPVIDIPRPVVTAARPLLADGWRAPWWLVYLAPVGAVVLFALVARSIMHPGAPNVQCRLCTVENGTFANGSIPIRELRHQIEMSFPSLDATCVSEAKEPGRATIKWTISGGDVDRNATSVAGGGRTGECLRDLVVRSHYPIVLEGGEAAYVTSMGYTEITYILEWNPSFDPIPPRASSPSP